VRSYGRYIIRKEERYQRLGEVLGVRRRMINIPLALPLNFRARKRIRRIARARAINDPLARSPYICERRIVHRAPGSWYQTISTRRWYTISSPDGGSRTPEEMFPRNGRSFSRIEPNSEIDGDGKTIRTRVSHKAKLRLARIRASGIINRAPLAWLHGF